MPDLDEELIARAVRWCDDAGRHASPAQVRAALAPLSWDQLLAVRARLADPPPARPLGPLALADLGRGTLPDVAAERERAGQYALDGGEATPGAAPAPRLDPARRTRTGGTRRARGATAPVIRRARDRLPSVPEGSLDRRDLLEDLVGSEGRAVLERLVREHGARRGPMVRALASGWRRADGTDPGSEDLDRLLRVHGLARAFARRERDELLHVLRATGGVLSAAAARAGATVEEVTASLERLGAAGEAEAIREAHRGDVRRRATLAERVRLLLTDADRLSDLGVLREVEDDLRARLPEHVRALRASGAAPLATALVQTLAMGPRDLPALLQRLGLVLDLGAPRAPGRSSADRPRAPSRPSADRPRAPSRPSADRPRAPSHRPPPPRGPGNPRAPGRGPRPAPARSGGPRRPPPRGRRTRSR